MFPPNGILSTWKKFDDFPMETLTKAWYYRQGSNKKQRDVSLMNEHRHQYGTSGNCFDLAIWLLDAFQKEGIQAYPIGHHIYEEEAHVAVIAVSDTGNHYLCDLGDQWVMPVLIDKRAEDFTTQKLSGFFPGAEIQVKVDAKTVKVFYHRPNGKISSQIYQTSPIEINDFLLAAEICQHNVHPIPLVECRIPYKAETAHWEFYNWESELSTSDGLIKNEKATTIEEWAEVIHQKTRFDRCFLLETLATYKYGKIRLGK